MHRIKTFRLILAHLDPFLGDDTQANLLNAGIDSPGQIAAGSIRLDNGKGG